MPGRYAVDYVSGYGSLCFVSSMGTSPYRHMAAESYCCGTYDRSGSDQRAGGDVAALYGRMGVQANERERFLADHRQCGIVGSVVAYSAVFWYVAAYQQGGEEFYRLAMEENFGRFTGTMSYESHENPVWYNFLSLAWGLAPYTLLLLFGVCVRSKKQEVGKEKLEVRRRIESWWNRLRGMDSVELFSLLAAVLIFLFYCFPKSKRSVYLLPVYPFVGYFIAVYVRKLAREGNGVSRLTDG